MQFSPIERGLFESLGGPSNFDPTTNRGLLISGPPGSGKTTLVKALEKQLWLKPTLAYVEKPEANPYFNQGRIALPARQRWFLRQYDDLIQKQSREKYIILDQDPRAVVLVYTKAYSHRGWVTKAEYRKQLRLCANTITTLRASAVRWVSVILSAPRDLLIARLEEREPALDIDGDMLGEIFSLFDDFRSTQKVLHAASCHEFDTRTSTEQLVRQLRLTLTSVPS